MLHHNRTSLDFACVYKIVCKKNGLIYVGQTNNFGHRMREHARSVARYETTSVWWASVFAKVYGAKDFNEDYDVTILEYFDIDDPAELREELNRSEKYWIKTLNSTDRSIGFNTQSGGWQLCKLPDNKLMRQGFTRKAYYLYDYVSNEITMIYSLEAIADRLHYPKTYVKCSKRALSFIDNRYLVLDQLASQRASTVLRVYKTHCSAYNTSNSNRKAQGLMDIVRKLHAYCCAETAIIGNYNIKDTSDDDAYKYDDVGASIFKSIERWRKVIAELELEYVEASSTYFNFKDPGLNGFSAMQPLLSQRPVKVVNVKTGSIAQYITLNDFVDTCDISIYNFYKKMRTGNLIAGTYLVYFVDEKLREYFMNSVRKENANKHEGKVIMRYVIGYLRTRPQGPRFLVSR